MPIRPFPRDRFTALSKLSLILCFCVAAINTSYADEKPDYEREARLAEQIVDDIFDGEPLWLKANGREFLSIYTPNEEQARGSVIILHGRGVHPDWPDVVGPLRVGLVEAGWSTLSLQMPVLERGKTYYDYLPLLKYSHQRIAAAITYIREQSELPVVLIAHSCGAHMANDWLNTTGDASIDGYVILGAGATDYRQEIQTGFPFADMRVPILDLYGENEFPRPLAMVPERLDLIKKGGNAQSSQQRLADADHYFSEVGTPLTEAVASWLNSTDFSRNP